MPKTPQGQLVPLERIESRIFVLRGHRVMLDRDLAGLYGVATRVLNQAVKRNKDRFPDDFMFRLTKEETWVALGSRSQAVTLKRGQNIKYAPHVFTEHGAVMLANVLRSRVAIQASIQVVRAFVHLRQMLANHQDIARKLEALERKVGKHDADLQSILAVLRTLLQPPPVELKKKPMGFVTGPTRK
jgi:ORF6N domain-containing protein